MNCSEFRRRLLVEPHDPALAEAARAGVCADASQRLAEAIAFEDRIAEAMAVPVPAGLADRILAALPEPATGADVPGRWRPRPLQWLAAAAAVAVFALGMLWTLPQRSADPTEELLLASVEHLAHEPYALTRSSRVPPALANRVFAEADVRLDASALDLVYLNRCPLGHWRSLHAVVRAPEGPVTAMYVPHQAVERSSPRSSSSSARAGAGLPDLCRSQRPPARRHRRSRADRRHHRHDQRHGHRGARGRAGCRNAAAAEGSQRRTPTTPPPRKPSPR
jgi:hypothetical protein